MAFLLYIHLFSVSNVHLLMIKLLQSLSVVVFVRNFFSPLKFLGEQFDALAKVLLKLHRFAQNSNRPDNSHLGAKRINELSQTVTILTKNSF